METIPEKITRDQLLFKEFITAVFVVILVFWTALFFPAPLSNPGTEGLAAGSRVQAPWIFLAVQTLLGYLPPIWAGLILPAGALFLLALFPWGARFGLGPRTLFFLFWILLLSGAALTVWGVWGGR